MKEVDLAINKYFKTKERKQFGVEKSDVTITKEGDYYHVIGRAEGKLIPKMIPFATAIDFKYAIDGNNNIIIA